MSTTVLTELKPVDFLPAKGAARPRRTASNRRRRVRINWEAAAVILLMLASAAVGLYRLVWMGQL